MPGNEDPNKSLYELFDPNRNDRIKEVFFKNMPTQPPTLVSNILAKSNHIKRRREEHRKLTWSDKEKSECDGAIDTVNEIIAYIEEIKGK